MLIMDFMLYRILITRLFKMRLFLHFIYLFIYFWLHCLSMWDLSSLTRNQTHAPCLKGQILNNWNTSGSPYIIYVLYRASQVALVVKNLPASSGDARDMGLIPGLGRLPGERKQHTSLFLPRKSHGQSSLMGCTLWGFKQ